MEYLYRQLNPALQRKSLVKVIAGMSNFDPARVLMIAKAAQEGGADAVDIAADISILKQVKEAVSIPVFVSATDLEKLQMASDAGADVVELDYDLLYKEGKSPSAEEIYNLAHDLSVLTLGKSFLSVTIAGTLPVAEQVALAPRLAKVGAHILQTEGVVGAVLHHQGTKGMLEAALDALTHTIEVRKASSLPILISGGMGVITAPFAVAAGADGIGVGSAISKLSTYEEMVSATKAIVAAYARLDEPGRIIE